MEPCISPSFLRTEIIQQTVLDCSYSYLIQDMKTNYDLLRKRFRNKNKCLIVHPDINLFGHLIQSFEKLFFKRFDQIKILLSWAGIFLTTFLYGCMGFWGQQIAK